MKELLLRWGNFGLMMLTTLILGSLQTSFWFQIFGYFPSPNFWMPVLVYIALFRSSIDMLIQLLLLSIALAPLTVSSLTIIFMTNITLGTLVRLVKQRFYWERVSYFMMTCGASTLVWHIMHWISSWIWATQPLSFPALDEWLIQALLTPLIAPPLYDLLNMYDRITQRDTALEASNEGL